MIIQIERGALEDAAHPVFRSLRELGLTPTSISTPEASYIINSSQNVPDPRLLKSLPGVLKVYHTDTGYPLVSRQWKKRTVISLENGAAIGGEDLAVMAGPCSVESEEQIDTIARNLRKNHIQIMRGGAFKPRSSPYSFRGLGIEGLKMFSSICKSYGLAVISEIMTENQLESMYPYIDIFQVGARNSQNYSLLDALGKTDKPVLLKRGLSGSIDELLHSAEYVFSGGNEKIILCERGIRTYEKAYRNTFDINAILVLKEKTHLPVIADPSHGIGLRRHVPALALAAISAGADGLIYELHPHPEKAWSDGAQTLNFAEGEDMLRKIAAIRSVLP